MKRNKKHDLTRRDFIKLSGIGGAVLSIGGIAGAGYFSGKDKSSYTGWGKNAYGEEQFFNRKPYIVDSPTYEKVAKTRRIQYLACIIHAASLGYIQGVENRRHSVLFQGFRNAVDALKLMHL